MRTTILERAGRAVGRAHFIPQSRGAIVLAALLLAATNLFGGATKTHALWVSGGPNPGVPNLNANGACLKGPINGDIQADAEYNTPCGIAVDITGQNLYVADRGNHSIRWLQFDSPESDTGQAYTFAFTGTNSNPIGVAIDIYDNVFVLNYGKGTNGTVLEFDYLGDLIATNMTRLTNAGGIALDTVGNIYVTASNTLFRITSPGVSNVVATITTPGASLQGIVVKHNGLIAACDSGRNGIYLINPTSGAVTTNAGFHGAGDFTTNGNFNTSQSNLAKFFQPMGVAEAGDGSLIVTDFGNHRVKVVKASDGTVTNLYGVYYTNWSGTMPGLSGGTPDTDSGLDEIVTLPDSSVPNANARTPFGVAFAPDGTIYVTETNWNIIRHVVGASFSPPPPPPPAAPTGLTATTNFGQVILTWTASFNATSYNIKRSPSSGGPYSPSTIIANTTGTSYTDTNVDNGATYYYVVSALNSGGEGPNSLEASATLPIPPPPAPRIGWFDYEGNELTGFFSVLHPVSGLNTYTAHNDLSIAIDPVTNGLSTYYITTNGPQPVLLVPSSTNGSSPPFYQDNWAGFLASLPVTTMPDLVIKAVNVGPGGSSPIVTSEFLFIVANPTINGLNGAQFTISDITSNAVFWYTINGADPTNAPPSIGPIAVTNISPATLSINVNSNIIFKVRAFRDGYLPSGTAVQSFSPDNFVPNTISFGFVYGEASSDFIASPGQTFYAPITLGVLGNALIYSLQFNVTVTNAPGPAITPGAFGFESMLKKPDPNDSTLFLPIPPYMFINTNAPYLTNTVYYEGSTNFVSMLTTNLSLNLLGVGWLERYSKTNLYDTKKQDLIKFSMAHDTLFDQNGGKVVLGGYMFQVPTNAGTTNIYKIQIDRPSATADGIGMPGSSVFIYAPTNGSLTNGTVNSVKNVRMGQRKYIAGNAYPFSWFNAGDFGNTNLQNADVEQVFQSAIYYWNFPPPGSDFFDAMDSCGATYVDLGHGYLELNTPVTDTNLLNLLFNGNDTTINQIAFGDGALDVCDVYVTYRRSLDPSLTWFRRFWTNGVRVAETVSNVFNPSVVSKSSSLTGKMAQLTGNNSVTNQPKVIFTAGDCKTNAGSTIQIPITASILGNYPLRTLMLNLTVEPLDGSPALTTPVAFSYNPALGSPWTTDQQGNGNYSAVWLNSGISGLSGNVSIGTLTVVLPSTATSLSAYAVHFDHVSASPNGIASFPKQAITGLITFSSRTNSSYGDGIPDSWRLRYFLTLNNYLSQTNADADGDGRNNLQEYQAGTDPTDPASFFKNIGTDPGAAQQTQDCVISWPSVMGKQYVIQRSPRLSSSPSWTSIATNNGTGNIMEYHDPSGGGVRFYRVRVQ